jgi:hypothetical protein
MTKSLESDFHPPTEFVNRLLGVCVVDRVPGGPMRLSKCPGLFRNKEIWFGPDPQAQRSVLYSATATFRSPAHCALVRILSPALRFPGAGDPDHRVRFPQPPPPMVRDAISNFPLLSLLLGSAGS